MDKIISKLVEHFIANFLTEENMLKVKSGIMNFLAEKAKETSSPIDDHVVAAMDKILDDLIRSVL